MSILPPSDNIHASREEAMSIESIEATLHEGERVSIPKGCSFEEFRTLVHGSKYKPDDSALVETILATILEVLEADQHGCDGWNALKASNAVVAKLKSEGFVV